MCAAEVDTNKETALVILANSLGGRDAAENMVRLLELQAYSDGFVAGMGCVEEKSSEGWDSKTP